MQADRQIGLIFIYHYSLLCYWRRLEWREIQCLRRSSFEWWPQVSSDRELEEFKSTNESDHNQSMMSVMNSSENKNPKKKKTTHLSASWRDFPSAVPNIQPTGISHDHVNLHSGFDDINTFRADRIWSRSNFISRHACNSTLRDMTRKSSIHTLTQRNTFFCSLTFQEHNSCSL